MHLPTPHPQSNPQNLGCMPEKGKLIFLAGIEAAQLKIAANMRAAMSGLILEYIPPIHWLRKKLAAILQHSFSMEKKPTALDRNLGNNLFSQILISKTTCMSYLRAQGL